MATPSRKPNVGFTATGGRPNPVKDQAPTYASYTSFRMHDISVAAPGHLSCAPQSGTSGIKRVNTSNKGKNRGKLMSRQTVLATFA